MSSILDALKKLEKGKIHRDGISTAIASDILRSGKKVSTPQWRVPLVLFVLAILVTLLIIFFFRTPESTPTVQTSSLPVVKIENVAIAKPVQTSTVIVSSQPLPLELPLLSGIVYQQKSAARMAILNDLPVMEGTIIAGYTLAEIFADRVILTRKGKSFTLFVAP